MLVLGGVHVPPELVGRSPQLILKAEIGTITLLFCHLYPLLYSSVQRADQHFHDGSAAMKYSGSICWAF